MPHSQKKRAKKTSNGLHKNKKNPMTTLWQVLNDKGQFRALAPVQANKFSVTWTGHPANPEQARINRMLYPHLFMD